MSLQKVAYGFIPTSITGCQLWLDGADSSATGGGATVSTWLDKSTVKANATYVTAAPPLVSSAINGLSALSFTGTEKLTGSISITGNTLSIFSVFTLNSSSGLAGRLISLAASGTIDYANNAYTALQRRVSSQVGIYRNGTEISSPITYSSNTLHTAYYDGTNEYVYTNGGTVYTNASSGNFSISAYMIGANLGYSSDNQPWNGYIGEVIVYNIALSAPQRQQVEGYLAQKWGLTSSLPVGHSGLTTTLYRADYTKQNIMRAIPYYTAFSPRSIAGCALWLDAADSSTITKSGSVVTQWNDKSGNGRNTTTIGGSPTYSSNFINLNGSSTYLVGPYVNTTQYLTMFVIATVDFSQGNYAFYYRLLSVGSTAANDYGSSAYTSILHNASSTQIGGYRNFAFNYNTVITNTTFLICLQYDGTNSINYLNGGSASSVASTGSFGTTSYSIGRDVGNTDGGGSYTYWPGKVGEVIIYNSSLSITQRQQVESYLAQKWGLTASLPGDHLNATQPAGAVTTTALANYRTVSVPRRYVSFKWTITAGNTESLIQFSEFQVGFNGTQLVFASPTTATTGSSISWNTGAGEGPAQAVDNNLNTKGLGIGTSGLVLIVTVATPIAANMYRWATANDVTPGRNPTQWTVDGSVDGVTFVRLHTQNTTYSTPSSTFTYTSWIPFTYS
jgi:hypothetical protein